MSGQIHPTAALRHPTHFSWKATTETIKFDDGWAPEAVWISGRIEKYVTLPKVEPRFIQPLAHSPYWDIPVLTGLIAVKLINIIPVKSVLLLISVRICKCLCMLKILVEFLNRTHTKIQSLSLCSIAAVTSVLLLVRLLASWQSTAAGDVES